MAKILIYSENEPRRVRACLMYVLCLPEKYKNVFVGTPINLVLHSLRNINTRAKKLTVGSTEMFLVRAQDTDFSSLQLACQSYDKTNSKQKDLLIEPQHLITKDISSTYYTHIYHRSIDIC